MIVRSGEICYYPALSWDEPGCFFRCDRGLWGRGDWTRSEAPSLDKYSCCQPVAQAGKRYTYTTDKDSFLTCVANREFQISNLEHSLTNTRYQISVEPYVTKLDQRICLLLRLIIARLMTGMTGITTFDLSLRSLQQLQYVRVQLLCPIPLRAKQKMLSENVTVLTSLSSKVRRKLQKHRPCILLPFQLLWRTRPVRFSSPRAWAKVLTLPILIEPSTPATIVRPLLPNLSESNYFSLSDQ